MKAAPVATILTCPKCRRSTVTLPAAEAWCLPCGRRMQPVTVTPPRSHGREARP